MMGFSKNFFNRKRGINPSFHVFNAPAEIVKVSHVFLPYAYIANTITRKPMAGIMVSYSILLTSLFVHKWDEWLILNMGTLLISNPTIDGEFKDSVIVIP
jgi:hypothetical protein